MSRPWAGVALLVGWLGLVASARAQAPVPEPIPCGPAMPAVPPASQAPQGPLPPQLAPKGPPADVVLPADIPGAFTDCPPEEEADTYFNLGAQGYLRQQPGHGSVAVIDTHNTSRLKNGKGPTAERFLQTVLDDHDLHPDMGWGIEGTLGYEWGGNALEVTGFYIFDNKTSAQVADPGRLFLPFTHPPLGFEGDNGLWKHADLARLTLEQSLGDAEFNYRWWNQAIRGFQGILGIRYIDMEERLFNFTGQDDLTVLNINLQPDPKREATYRVLSHNHLVAPQFGFEWNAPVCSWVSFSWTAKVALGADFLDVNYSLTRGDGLVGRAVARFDTLFSEAYETGFFLDFWLCESGRLRAGYNLLWLANIAEAAPQVNYNLKNQESMSIRQGSVLYHGPQIELEFRF